MLSRMQMSGDVMVVGHEGLQNIWGLSERFLPSWVNRTALSEEEFEVEAAQRAIRALGTASPREIHYYFVRGRYQNLKKAVERLQKESAIHRISVKELGWQGRAIHSR